MDMMENGHFADDVSSSSSTSPAQNHVKRKTCKRIAVDPLDDKDIRVKKLSRNACEKLRRDKLHEQFSKLSELVPVISRSQKSLDKTNILRLSVNYLRLQQQLRKASLLHGWHHKVLNWTNFGDLLLQLHDGFMLILTMKGVVLFASDLISSILAVEQVDVFGHSVYNIIHKVDHVIMRDLLHSPTDESRHHTICLRMKHHTSTKPNVTYRQMEVSGRFLLTENTGVTGRLYGSTASYETGVIFVCVCRLDPKPNLNELVPVQEDAPVFNSYHDMLGTIIQADHRQALFNGYLPKELNGNSPFQFMHPDDVAHVIINLNKVTEPDEDVIESTINRQIAVNGEIIYINSRTYKNRDRWTKQPYGLVSVNTVILDTELAKQLLERQRQNHQKMVKMGTADDTLREELKEPHMKSILEIAKTNEIESNSSSNSHLGEGQDSAVEIMDSSPSKTQHLSASDTEYDSADHSTVSSHGSPVHCGNVHQSHSIEDASDTMLNSKLLDSSNTVLKSTSLDTSTTMLNSPSLDDKSLRSSEHDQYTQPSLSPAPYDTSIQSCSVHSNDSSTHCVSLESPGLHMTNHWRSQVFLQGWTTRLFLQGWATQMFLQGSLLACYLGRCPVRLVWRRFSNLEFPNQQISPRISRQYSGQSQWRVRISTPSCHISWITTGKCSTPYKIMRSRLVICKQKWRHSTRMHMSILCASSAYIS